MMMFRRAVGHGLAVAKTMEQRVVAGNHHHQRALFSRALSSTAAASGANENNHRPSNNPRRRCRVVVCGGGRMGEIRSGVVYSNPRFELCGIVDSDPTNANRLADLYSTQAFTDLSSVLDRFKIRDNNGDGCATTSANDENATTSLDGLIVTVPTPHHGRYVTDAAKNGLGVFVEKPVSDSVGEIRALYRECEKRGVPLCCGFQRRFDGSYVDAANAVREGEIGNVTNATVFFGDSPGPTAEFLKSSGGNIFHDLSVHDVDYLRYALGTDRDIHSVYAVATSSDPELAEANVQDNATMVMTTKAKKTRRNNDDDTDRSASPPPPSPTIITLTMNRSTAHGYDQRCEFIGDKGAISIGNEPETTAVVSDKSGFRSSRLKNSFDTRFHDAFYNEMDAFADVLLSPSSSQSLSSNANDAATTRTKWPVTEQDAIRAQKIATAAKESFETNRIVYINDDDDDNDNNVGKDDDNDDDDHCVLPPLLVVEEENKAAEIRCVG